MSHLSRDKALGAALATLVSAALVGCSGGGADGTQGSEGGPAGELPTIQHNLGPREYRDLVDETLTLLQEYWSEELAAEGEESGPPAGLVSYWNRRQDKGCGGRPAGRANAQYCPRNDTISWDGNWLHGDLYRLAGEAAVAFLLAHEYGHLVQDRLGVGNDFRLTIEAELNADCLAGAWFGAVDEEVARLTDDDYLALYGGVLDVADPAGLPWQNPQAHGTADERGDALLFGGRKGPRACFRRYGPGFTR